MGRLRWLTFYFPPFSSAFPSPTLKFYSRDRHFSISFLTKVSIDKSRVRTNYWNYISGFVWKSTVFLINYREEWKAFHKRELYRNLVSWQKGICPYMASYKLRNICRLLIVNCFAFLLTSPHYPASFSWLHCSDEFQPLFVICFQFLLYFKITFKKLTLCGLLVG